MSEATSKIIERRLKEALAPEHVEVVDESHLHAGHPGSRSGGGHFCVLIVSSVFEGQPALARHRAVHRALSGEIGSSIHALSITALTRAEWRGTGPGRRGPR